MGLTTTVPVEVVFAGGYVPCDLNNIFITDPDPVHYIDRAERDGFPRGMCNWVKGIYGVVMEKKIPSVITVMEGDCSNTQALAEILRYRGVRTIPFSYPFDRDEKLLKREIKKLEESLGVNASGVRKAEVELTSLRSGLKRIDRMTWDQNVVTGQENHLWLVRSSDMLGNYETYGSMVKDFIEELETRMPMSGIRLGYIGVPPIILNLYDFIESIGARVVYNETQRQFSLPFDDRNIVKKYLAYTYPYGVFARMKDIKTELERRGIQGIIHYVQSFCFRAIEDVIFRELIGVPVITIEGDMPRTLDTRTKLRLEAFVEMLRGAVDGTD